MKNLFVILFVAGLSSSVWAQDVTSEIELFQSVFNMEKKAMVAEFMALNDEQSIAFWEVYNAYETERSILGKQRIELLQRYADKYENMNDESAAGLLKDFIKLQSSMLKVKQKYTNKVSKAIGAKKGLQFIQFEEYLDRAVGMFIMNNVPFVGELD